MPGTKSPHPASLLRRLEDRLLVYDTESGAEKRRLLALLGRRRLASAGEVARLHECLCFLKAFPDDRETFDLVERLLVGFADRGDLRRHRRSLINSGIAGTEIRYGFYWAMARWLTRRWPDRVSIRWPEVVSGEALDRLLYLLVTESETPALDELDLGPERWVEALKGPEESDARFLVERFMESVQDEFWRERLFDDLDLPMKVAPGPGTPCRTLERYPVSSIHFQRRELDRTRPALRAAAEVAPLAVRALSPAAGGRLIDLARTAMVARSRDLDAFANADRRDVRLIDCHDGLQFACLGVRPERRLLLEAVYGLLTLKNGVPIGYALASSLFGSTEIAYNVFDTFRRAESARVFGQLVGAIRHLFGSDSFSIDPYQLGYGNKEGLASGAWWFYYKLGFRPRDAEVRRLVRRERERMKRRPGHRSTQATLEQLASAHVFFHLGKRRDDVMGSFSSGAVGMAVAGYLAERFGAARSAGVRTCVREARELLHAGDPGGRRSDEKLAWRRWSPLVMALPGVAGWPRPQRQALARVIDAKGGHRESDFVDRFNRHGPLRESLLELAAG